MKTFEPQEIFSTYNVFLFYKREYNPRYYKGSAPLIEFTKLNRLEEGLLYIRDEWELERYLGYYNREEKLVYAYTVEKFPYYEELEKIMEYKEITGNYKEAIVMYLLL